MKHPIHTVQGVDTNTIELLGKLKGITIHGFQCALDHGQVFGNAMILTNKGNVEVRNEMTLTELPYGSDELARLTIRKMKEGEPFEPDEFCPVQTFSCALSIETVQIVTDHICMERKGDSPYQLRNLTAIVFKGEKDSLVITQDWIYDSFLKIGLSDVPEKRISPLSRQIEDWSDEEEDIPAQVVQEVMVP
jgi:hypothetical protein